jgi:NADPH:quinone reductase-like Zn-dependent oxidoreductase
MTASRVHQFGPPDIIVSGPDQEAVARRGIRALFTLIEVTTAHLGRIAEMIDAGTLTKCVGAVLSRAEARRAHEVLEGTPSRQSGKIALRVSE